jgi:uncharacterized protein YecT (DUF1311 family)
VKLTRWAALLAAALTLASAGEGTASTEQTLNQCLGQAITQSAMDQCASAELSRAQAQMEQQLSTLRARAQSERAQMRALGYGGDPMADILAEEKAWNVFRDAYLDAAFPVQRRSYYGSIYPFRYALEKAELTREHTKALQRLLQDRQSPDRQ